MGRGPVVLLLLMLLATGAMPPVQPGPAALPAAFVPPPILMYHRVDVDHPTDPVGRELTITPTQFAGQLAYLKSRGIRGISMDELRRRLDAGQTLGHVVVLTFDDGYADQYAYALPLLRRYGDDATFYVITSTVGTARHLTWKQLAAMKHDGEDIAAHGVEHDDLSTMSNAQQAFQIDDSVRELRSRLHVPVDSYGYPSGRFNRATLELVQQAGVQLAVTTDPAFVIGAENRFELTRVRVRSDWSAADFGAAVEAALTGGRVVLR